MSTWRRTRTSTQDKIPTTKTKTKPNHVVLTDEDIPCVGASNDNEQNEVAHKQKNSIRVDHASEPSANPVLAAPTIRQLEVALHDLRHEPQANTGENGHCIAKYKRRQLPRWATGGHVSVVLYVCDCV